MDPSFPQTPSISVDAEPTVVLRHSGATAASDETVSMSSYDSSRDALDGIDLDEIEVIRGSYQKIKSFGLALKIHLGLGVAVCVLCMLIWHWQSNPICEIQTQAPYTPVAPIPTSAPSDAPQQQQQQLPPVAGTLLKVEMPKFWWFFYPFLVFAFTVPAHHFFTEAKWEKIGLTFGIVLNLMLFFTWAFRMPLGNTYDCAKNVGPDGQFLVGDTFTSPWPIFPAAVTAIAAVAIHYWKQPKEQRKVFRLLLNEYWIINVSLFLIWLFYGQGHPWFMYPLFILALPVIVHRMRYVYKETRMWTYAAVVAIDLNLLLFLTWIFTPTGFPWPLIIAGLSFGGVWFLMKRESRTPIPSAAAWEGSGVAASDPSLSSVSISQADD